MKPDIWAQLKNITADEFIRALENDGWKQRGGSGARRVFLKDRNLVSIHYHPKKTYGRNMLKDLLKDIGWNENDLKRLKLIK
jgi:predicted RNA binding protein YcfA (HicA-like mRNA interferase family)